MALRDIPDPVRQRLDIVGGPDADELDQLVAAVLPTLLGRTPGEPDVLGEVRVEVHAGDVAVDVRIHRAVEDDRAGEQRRMVDESTEPAHLPRR